MRTLLQHLAPQQLLTSLAGYLGNCHWGPLKNLFIKLFIKLFGVKLTEAKIEDITAYPSFNAFFTRQLKPEARLIVKDENLIACPVDGCVSQIGNINQESIFQAKEHYFDLTALVGDKSAAQQFIDGEFATFYLSPKDYHRVHMPISGSLRKTIYIPGKLFSVSQHTVGSVPNLFSRNKRLVCFFDTEMGPMAYIMVGAMLVGSINTVWEKNICGSEIITKQFDDISLLKGEELGYFEMGSTVILLFPKNVITWSDNLKAETSVKMGMEIAKINVTFR